MTTKQICTFFAVAVLTALLPPTAMADEWDANNYRPDNIVKLNNTNLPIVFIDTRDSYNAITAIHKDYRVAARMKVIMNDNGVNYGDTLLHPNQKTDYEGWVAIKYRGNSSFKSSPKKPLGFKTLASNDVNGKKEKVKIMGMPKDNDWVMLAPYQDRSLIRDVLMFELARPWFDYTPKARFCEVVLDGIYYGIYIMTEKAGKGNNRLNLETPGDSGDELTGGYQIEIDRNDEEHYHTSKYLAQDEKGRALTSNNVVYYQYKAPEYDDMMPDHPAQLNYIDNLIDAMEDTFASDDFKNPDTGYRKYIDVTSFIDQMLSQEFSHNVDGYRLSTTLYKHRDSVDPHFKTTLWDFNLAFGNNYYDIFTNSDWLYYNKRLYQSIINNKVPFWWARLMEDPAYVDELKARWTRYRHGSYRDDRITATIDSLVYVLNSGGARERNEQAWPNWDKDINLVPNRGFTSYDQEIDYLRSWIAKHAAWMDSQLDYDPNALIAGDVNDDGAVNVGDIMAIINFMAGLTAGINDAVADVNHDGAVNVGDIMAIINIMAGK